jgi:pimeloyl-ACP methyl ester carboxylesterase
MHFLERDGVRLHYEDRGSGPAILLTHGYTATLRMWDPQVAELSKRYRAISWDMRGHGESDSPAEPAAYSHESTADDMAALLDHCGVEKAVVGGLSLGGYMSLAFYVAHPQRVRALMLFDTGPGYRKDEGRAEWNRLAESYARRFERDGLAALGAGEEVKIARHRSAQGLAHAARGILAQKDARAIEVLPSITVPTLLVAGSEDKPFLAGMDYMARKIPGAVKVVIEGAGHTPNLEKPEQFNRAVGSFLDGV